MWLAFILLLTLFCSGAWVMRKRRQFWKRLGVAQCKRPNLVFGDHPLTNWAVVCGKTSVYEGSVNLYNSFKGDKYFGVYGFPSSPPILAVSDLDLLNHILGRCVRAERGISFYMRRSRLVNGLLITFGRG